MHLLLDLGLGERRMSSKAYVLRRLGLGGRQLGVMFEDIKLRVHSSEADRIGLDTLAKTMGDGIGGTVAISEADSIEVTTTESESESESECLDPQMSCEPRARRVCTTTHPGPPHPHPGTHGAHR